MATVTINPGDNVATAISGASAGDTIQFEAGIYPLCTFATSGKDGLTIQGRGRDVTILLGSKRLTGWTTTGTANVWQVTGQTQQETSTSDSGYLSDATEYANALHPEDLFVRTGAGDWTILLHKKDASPSSGTPATLTAGYWWFDYTNNIIYMYSTTDPDNYEVYTSVEYEIDTNPGEDITYKDLTISHYAQRYGKVALWVETGAKLLNIRVSYNHSGGAQIRHNTLVAGCVFDYNGQIGFKCGNPIANGSGAPLTGYVPNTYMVFVGNKVAYNNSQSIWYRNEVGGAKFSFQEYGIIAENEFDHNEGVGLWSDINNRYLWIMGNIIHYNQREAIKHETCYRAYIAGNWCGHNGYDYETISDFGWDAQIQISTSENCIVEDNDVVVNATYGNGIIIIHQERANTSPPNQPAYASLVGGYTTHWASTSNVVRRNRVAYLGTGGWSGVSASSGQPFGGSTASFWAVHANSFNDNDYWVPSSQGTGTDKFRWNDAAQTWTEFQGFGQEATGSFSNTTPPSDLTTVPTWAGLWFDRPYKDRYLRDPKVFAQWLLNEASGTSIVDRVSGYNGTLNNTSGVTYGNAGIGDGETVIKTPAAGTAWIDLHSASLNAGLETSFDARYFSVMLWARLDDLISPAGAQYMLEIGKQTTDADNALLRLQKTNTGTPNGALQIYAKMGAGTTHQYNASSNSFPQDTWTFFGQSLDGDRAAWIANVNGAQVDEETGSTLHSSSLADFDNRMVLFQRGNSSSYFYGSIYNVIVASRPFTTNEFWLAHKFNRLPQLTAITNKESTEDIAISTVNVSATLTGSETATYYAYNLPTGLSINSSTGAITGTPTTTGTYYCSVGVKDNDTNLPLTASDSFNWTIYAAPVITDPTSQSKAEGASVSLQLTATDPYGGGLTWTIQSGGISGLSIGSSTGLISGTVAYTASGSSPYTMIVRATDDIGGYDEQSITWTITNTPPVITEPGAQENTENDEVSLPLVATDPAGGGLTWTLHNGTLPGGLTVNSAGQVISGSIGGSAASGSPYSAVIRATDTSGSFDGFTLEWTVNAANSGSVAKLGVMKRTFVVGM